MEINGRSKGCAIVVMNTVEEAQSAVNALHGKDMQGRTVFLREDREKENFTATGVGEPGSSVYVGNLSWVTKWQELKDHMKRAGNVLRANLMMDGDRSRGCGVVEFSTSAEANYAIQTLNDSELHGRLILVRCPCFPLFPHIIRMLCCLILVRITQPLLSLYLNSHSSHHSIITAHFGAITQPLRSLYLNSRSSHHSII
jgi:RNA recognition motif-containing protein